MSAIDGSVRGSARPTLEQSFNWRFNSLNFLRLVLAAAVIFTHASQLSIPSSEDLWHLGKTTIGTVAVYCFFGISGFLIARSATKNGAFEYFWKRFLRIFPAFWICLLVIAFGFGLIGWFHSNPGHDCGMSCYLREPDGPVSYIYRNFFLYIGQAGISNTLRGSALPNLWNGSIWTLWWEFLCYVVLAVAAFGGLLRRRWPLLAATVLLWGVYAVVVAYPGWNSQVNAFHLGNWMSMLRLFPVFLLGSCIYLYREKIPDSGLLAAISSAAFLVSFVVPIGDSVPGYTLTSTDLAAVFVVYPMIWLGIHLPFRKVGSKNDYSYGIYIYGFPMQQLLAIFGVVSWGYFAYSVLGVLCTVPLAVLSWWLIEKQAARLKDVHLRFRRVKAVWAMPEVIPEVSASGQDAAASPEKRSG